MQYVDRRNKSYLLIKNFFQVGSTSDLSNSYFMDETIDFNDTKRGIIVGARKTGSSISETNILWFFSYTRVQRLE